MKTYLLVSLFFVQACVSANVAMTPKAHIADAFTGFNACFLLYNLKTGKLETQFNEEQCHIHRSPCSTFKVPLALMAFDAKVLKDENTLYKWDGKKDPREVVNHDQTAASWMSNSVVWYSQRITPKLGMKKIKKYLSDFDYGNEDFSGGLKTSWLSGKGAHDSLKISPLEQLEFLKKWWKRELPVSAHAYDMTNKITYLETSPKGYALNGKTGSGYLREDERRQQGWFISHLQKGDEEYVAVTMIEQKPGVKMEGYGGLKAKAITKEILTQQGLW
jgi:beta-lactamase class D